MKTKGFPNEEELKLLGVKPEDFHKFNVSKNLHNKH